MYNKDTVGYSCEQRWFNLFVDIGKLTSLFELNCNMKKRSYLATPVQAQQDAPTQGKAILT
jgi:hypothetical protein